MKGSFLICTVEHWTKINSRLLQWTLQFFFAQILKINRSVRSSKWYCYSGSRLASDPCLHTMSAWSGRRIDERSQLKAMQICLRWSLGIVWHTARGGQSRSLHQPATHIRNVISTKGSQQTLYVSLFHHPPLRRLTPCLTVFAAWAAFFFVSYCVRTSIRPMKYTSLWGAPEMKSKCWSGWLVILILMT